MPLLRDRPMIEAYFILTDQSVVEGWVPIGRDIVRMGPNMTPFVYDHTLTEHGRSRPVYRQA